MPNFTAALTIGLTYATSCSGRLDDRRGMVWHRCPNQSRLADANQIRGFLERIVHQAGKKWGYSAGWVLNGRTVLPHHGQSGVQPLLLHGRERVDTGRR